MLVAWERKQLVLASIFALHNPVIQRLVFIQLHFLLVACFSFSICIFCYKIWQQYSVSALYLLFFLVFRATSGVVPISIRGYIVDTFWV